MNIPILHNIYSTIGKVFLRRWCSVQQCFNNTVAAVKASNGAFSNANAYQWGQPLPCKDFTEALIRVYNNGTTAGGAIVSALLMVQTYSISTGLWCNILATPVTITSAGFTDAANSPLGCAQINIIGDVIRVGLTCTSAGTTNDGSFLAEAVFKS